MPARLFSRVGETRGAGIEFTSEATIGRHPESSLVLEPSLISSRHAHIRYDEDAASYVLEDLESLNGTALDGQRVRGSECLGHLNVITFAGQHQFIFQDLEACQARHGSRTDEVVPAAPEPSVDRESRLEAGGVERTRAEKLPVAMPSFLVGPPDGDEGGEPVGEPQSPFDQTGVEKIPLGMPDNLSSRADAAAGDAGDLDNKTRIERLPFALPDALAGRARKLADPQPVETVELDAGTDLPPPGDVTLSERPAPPPPRPAGEPQLYLEFVGSDGRPGQRVLLLEGENIVGRGKTARIKPDSLDISRRHSVLNVAGARVTLRDLGSRNHTFLNDEQIDGEVRVEPGATLRFGSVEARLVVVRGDER